jgi:nucleoside 2-deoxyribosyltransferase
MKIYIGHSINLNYENELYAPLRNSALNDEHEIIFPNEDEEQKMLTKDIIKTADIVISDVTYSSTGVGIELGWADMLGKKPYCIYKTGHKVTSVLSSVTQNVFEYTDNKDLVKTVEEIIESYMLTNPK